MSDEERAEIQELSRQAREESQRFMKEHGAEIEKMRREIEEQSRSMREEVRHDWQANGEARHVGVRLESGIRLENVYVPAGGDVPDREINVKFYTSFGTMLAVASGPGENSLARLRTRPDRQPTCYSRNPCAHGRLGSAARSRVSEATSLRDSRRPTLSTTSEARSRPIGPVAR